MATKAIIGSIMVQSEDGTERTYNITVNPAAVTALDQFVAAQTVPDVDGKPMPKYADPGVLIISNLAEGLFSSVVQQFPSAEVQAAGAALAKAQADLNGAIAEAVHGAVTVG